MTVGDESNPGVRFVLAALAVFVTAYPSLLFLTGIHVVFVVLNFVPSTAVAVLVAGWVVQNERSLVRLWAFAVTYVGVAAVGWTAYRVVLEKLMFGDRYAIYYAFDRFSPAWRLVVLVGVAVVASLVTARLD